MTTDTDAVRKVLGLVERDLRARLLPELATPSGRLLIDYMTRLLQWASLELRPPSPQDAAYENDLTSLLGSDSVRNLPEAPVASLGSGGSGSVVSRLQAIGAAPPAEATLFERYVMLEAAHVEGRDAAAASGFTDIYQGGKLRRSERRAPIVIDAATLTAYLQNRFPEYPLASASNVVQLPGGFGKDTILFDIGQCGAFDGAAVIRKDFAVPPGPFFVTTEFPLLQALHRRGLPVATPLWAEQNPGVLGGAFIVSRCVAGATDIQGWSHDSDACNHFVDRLAYVLARIHALTPNELGYGEECDRRSGVQSHMRVYYDHYRARSDHMRGRIEVAYSWLMAHLPASDEMSARLVHGDVGFHNILTANGKIEAVLDWEFAHFGDPAEDIGYCWQFIEGLTDWATFMEMYRRHGGTPPSRAVADYYRIWSDFRNACMGVGAAATLKHGEEADIRSPTAGLSFTPLCEIQALRGALAWNNRLFEHSGEVNLA